MSPLAKLLEAALFASGRPIPSEELNALDPEASPAEIAIALSEISECFETEGHGVELVEIGGGWQILTRAEYTESIERAQLAPRRSRRSRSSRTVSRSTASRSRRSAACRWSGCSRR